MKRIALRYWKLALIIILLLGGVIYWSNRTAQQKTAKTITTTKVKQQDFVNTITSSGKTKAEKTVDLKFQTSGKLIWVGVKEGDVVKAYQALASLDKREVQKNLEKAFRDFTSERNDFDQAGLDSPANKPSDAANDRLKRILEKNQWDLEKAVLDVELKHLSVEFATLITPIAGIVTHIDTPVAGVNITPASAVFSVADPTSLVFEANVDETDISALSIGQIATITLDAFPQATFSGTISYISYTSEQSSGGATVFPVKIAFADPQNLRIGLNGDISIETDRQDDVLTVPSEAIREDKSGMYVYKKTDGKYEKTPVAVGKKNEDDVIITSGLTEGDIVVTRGFTNIPK
ncbi:MAG TPA: efflux RND transporter periplasmic adaptor subunit [Patescibacteria group bacterium]|nr:efflux RND transporter periplasmic adaptor subunit [Patescibacteria group bacterium]